MHAAHAGFEQLASHPALWRGSELARTRFESVASGFAELDSQLPGGGWPVGQLTELMPAHEGIGELRILGPALAVLCARRLNLAWIAPPHLPYAPALAAAGIDLARLVIVRTRSEKDALWATEQALASNACAAVLAWLPHARFPELRRLQLAAESGQTLAVLFRPPACGRESSPAALRIALTAAPGGLAARIVKRRGAPPGEAVLLRDELAARRKKASHDLDRTSFPATAAGHAAPRLALA